MKNNTLERRKRCVEAWDRRLDDSRFLPPNPLHDRDYYEPPGETEKRADPPEKRAEDLTPGAEELHNLAEKYAPPPEWYDEDE